jgi:mRNA interferase YafQ
MRAIVYKKRFKKDYQRIDRTGRDTARLFEAISLLQAGQPLPPHFRDHQLTGNLKDCRECHLGGDWLLLYQLNEETLVLIRTGSHSELFK